MVISREAHAAICAVLHEDRRQNGSAGRSLSCDLEMLGLQQGDRLEASDSLRDVGDFEKLNAFPFTVVFWRPSCSTMAHFRSSFWDENLGLTPAWTPALDILHTFLLGPMLALSSHIV